MGQEIHHYRRFKGYDYSPGASLFISMATEPQKDYFGGVKDANYLPFSSSHSLACSSPSSAALRYHSVAVLMFFLTP